MKSHLPEPVFEILQPFVWGLEEALQANGHTVAQAQAANPAFDTGWVESPLTRALISAASGSLAGNGLAVKDLGNGGVEVVVPDHGVERRFRVKHAKRDGRGLLDVRVSSDSILATTGSHDDPTLFDPPEKVYAPPVTREQWVLAYLLHSGTRTFTEVSAARVRGLATATSPYRLRLDCVTAIPHTTPPPPDFTPDQDDLDLGDDKDEDEGRGEDAA